MSLQNQLDRDDWIAHLAPLINNQVRVWPLMCSGEVKARESLRSLIRRLARIGLIS